MKYEFTKEEIDIIKNAVDEYEEECWFSESQKWQKIINALIDKLGRYYDKTRV